MGLASLDDPGAATVTCSLKSTMERYHSFEMVFASVPYLPAVGQEESPDTRERQPRTRCNRSSKSRAQLNDTATMDRLVGETSGEDMLWVHLQMHLAFIRGDIAKHRSLSDALVNRQRKANHMENVAEALAYHADVEAYLGNYHLARRLCAQADEAGNNSALGLFKCSHALGLSADTSHAEALAAKLNELFPENTIEQRVDLPVTHSTIQRARGNFGAAADLFSPVTQFPNVVVSYNRGRAYMAAGDQAKAIAAFQTVLDHPGGPDWGSFKPLSQLGLAQTYAKQGDSEKSRKAYEDFFATWKDADPDIPILKQAKAEYANLK